MNEKKLMKKTCGFAKAVVKKTQEIFEISQLKIKMVQIKNKIERKLVRIGYFVYIQQKNQDFEVLKEKMENEKFLNFCREIDGLYAKLKKLEADYAEIKSCIKKEAENCVKDCGCKEKKQKKEEFNNFKEELNEEKALITKDEEYEF